MCGIAGILRFDDAPVGRERLEAMLASIQHRGPDGQAIKTRGRCALLHARLAILDLPGGEQPMHAPRYGAHGPLSVVFNGEIYNHRELREHLESVGYPFQSHHSDTEVLLHGYREWGESLPRRLEGMFAFAVHDESTGRLMLARDRIGKKPLFYSRNDGEFIFASLIGSLLAAGADRAISPAAMTMFLRLGYCGYDSLIASVHELPPGTYMMVEPDGRCEQMVYWKPPPLSHSDSDVGLVKAVTEVTRHAVRSRLDSDVPLGCFLSGGIDSSLIAALAQQEMAANKAGPLRTFAVKMPVLDYDESLYAAEVARHLGTHHTELVAEGDVSIMDDLANLTAIYGEPTADSSILPTYWLSRATRKHVKVALSGDGGDELFGGYDRYRALRMLQRHRWWLRQFPDRVLSDSNPRSARTRLRRLTQAAQAPRPGDQYLSMIHLFTDRQMRQLGVKPSTGITLPDWPDGGNPVHDAMRWDLAHYLPMEVLRKVDRASMAVALEVRCPLLDRAVCEIAAHVPPHVLMPGGKAKGLLRAVAGQFLPPTIVQRPKRGFAIPIGHWFQTTLREPLTSRLTDGGLESIGIRRDAIRTLLDEHTQRAVDHTHRLFAMLQLSLWLQWLRNPRPPQLQGHDDH